MGSKLCKAILVRAGTKVASADPQRYSPPQGAARRARSAPPPPSTESSARWRTCSRSTRSRRCRHGTSPPRDSKTRRHSGPRRSRSSDQVARNSCASCSIGCEHIYKGPEGKKTRMEYENVFALGPLCGVSDADAVIAASSRCDELGLDTISTGGTIAWAMECVEKGLIDAPWLRFGDGDALLRAIEEIGARKGLGELLAQGSRSAAERSATGPRVRRAREGPRAARVRAADAAGDGARPGGQRPRRRSQPLRRLRGRPVGRPRPPRTAASPTSPARSRPRTAPRSWTR